MLKEVYIWYYINRNETVQRKTVLKVEHFYFVSTVDDNAKGKFDGIVGPSFKSCSKSFERNRSDGLDPTLQFRRLWKVRIGVESGLVQRCQGSGWQG